MAHCKTWSAVRNKPYSLAHAIDDSETIAITVVRLEAGEMPFMLLEQYRCQSPRKGQKGGRPDRPSGLPDG